MDHHSRSSHTESRQARWEQRTEIPLGVASLAYLAAYAVWVLGESLPEDWRDACLAVTMASWALFVVDYAVLWRMSGQGLRFVRKHWLDTIVLLLPLLRPLRFVRLYEAMQRRRHEPRLAVYARVMAYASMSVVLLGFTGALAVYHAEHTAAGASIRTFGEAVWWTCSTLATVGYGDVVPVTPMGRLVAVGLMCCGLALLAAVTGSFSSWLIQVFTREDQARARGTEARVHGERAPGKSPGP
ncbi:potassium channel family protein [Streptomyces sp. NPDC002896]|uniref:potassium channel family protein n=1 Tax=Streptomyces sp. NPDC002896 TaxID=3154438 RepID=UPI00331E6E7E